MSVNRIETFNADKAQLLLLMRRSLDEGGQANLEAAEEAMRSFLYDYAAHLMISDAAACPCGLPTCEESWEPGCGLGTSSAHVRVAYECPGICTPADFFHGRACQHCIDRKYSPINWASILHKAADLQRNGWRLDGLTFQSPIGTRCTMTLLGRVTYQRGEAA